MRLVSTFFLIAFTISSCNSISDERIAILINTEHNKFLEGNGYEQWHPSKSDLDVVKEIIENALKDNKLNFLDAPTIEGIENYYRQYIPYIDKNGHRIIEINAFCREFLKSENENRRESWEKWDWRNQYLIVADGGNCFWKIEVNLDQKTYQNISVNGLA